ncbi:hypothetical protein ACXIZN_11495 [Amycolatopsis sp. TRM77291]
MSGWTTRPWPDQGAAVPALRRQRSRIDDAIGELETTRANLDTIIGSEKAAASRGTRPPS